MRDLSDTEIAHLQALLDDLAAATPQKAPLDVSALDGFLCGVLLQPQPVPESRWWPFVLDAEGRAPPRSSPAAGTLAALLPLVRRRQQALDEAVTARRWFDPWIFELGAADANGRPPSLRDSVLPWVAGFALAAEQFPALMAHDARALAEPLALLYQHFDAADLEGLEDEPSLAAALEEAEPPVDLAEAAEDLVRAVLLLADVSRPPAPRPAPRTAPSHANPGPGPRSRSARPARARRR